MPHESNSKNKSTTTNIRDSPPPPPPPPPSLPLIKAADISKHNDPDDLWMVIDGRVYDLTDFAPRHPGGSAVLAQHAGADGSAAYLEVHPPSLIARTLPESCVVGSLDQSSVTKEWVERSRRSIEQQEEEEEQEVEGGEKMAPSSSSSSSSAAAAAAATTGASIGNKKKQPPPLDSLINTSDFAAAAPLIFSRKAWAFVSSAATDCLTHERNSSAYSHITLRPRVLHRDVSRPDLGTTVLGHRVKSPLFCAPTSMGKMFHPEGEREFGRACRRLGVPQCVSTSCSFSFGEVMDAVEEEDGEGDQEEDGDGRRGETRPDIPVFFQLYMDKDRNKSEALLREVVARGARAIFFTVDAPVIGKREADERVQADETLRMQPMTSTASKSMKADKKGGGVGRLIGGFIDSNLTWDAVGWIRSVVGPEIPIAIKGIQTAADAVRAMEFGADAIYISNHGGRSLDTSPATILVLLELQRCCPQVFDAVEVYVDGGIRRGTDIFKALCLGARAVGIGRGFLYGLSYGREGIEKYIGILNDELQTTMQMCGVTSLDQCHPGLVHTGAVDHLVPQGEEHPYAKWRPKSRL